MNETEKIDNYLDLARELKKLWNMKVTVIPIVVSTLGVVPKPRKETDGSVIRGRIDYSTDKIS